jgi:hypothetical protein
MNEKEESVANPAIATPYIWGRLSTKVAQHPEKRRRKKVMAINPAARRMGILSCTTRYSGIYISTAYVIAWAVTSNFGQ